MPNFFFCQPYISAEPNFLNGTTQTLQSCSFYQFLKIRNRIKGIDSDNKRFAKWAKALIFGLIRVLCYKTDPKILDYIYIYIYSHNF